MELFQKNGAKLRQNAIFGEGVLQKVNLGHLLSKKKISV